MADAPFRYCLYRVFPNGIRTCSLKKASNPAGVTPVYVLSSICIVTPMRLQLPVQKFPARVTSSSSPCSAMAFLKSSTSSYEPFRQQELPDAYHDYHSVPPFPRAERTFSAKTASAVSGLTESVSPSILTQTPLRQSPMQKVPAKLYAVLKSVFGNKTLKLFNYLSRTLQMARASYTNRDFHLL